MPEKRGQSRLSRPSEGAARVLLLAVLLAAACTRPAAVAERAVDEFVVAVQSEDTDRLYCLLAGASRSEDDADQDAARRVSFEQWVTSRYEAYQQGRDAGWVDLQGDGIVLTKAFTLGKGTFYTLQRAGAGSDTARVDMDVRFAYGDIDIAGLPPGAVFYVSGRTPGRIHAIRVPYRAGSVTEAVLDTLRVRWTLVREGATISCPDRWAVASVEPLDDTATTAEITWEF